jgi:hypothetical protein
MPDNSPAALENAAAVILTASKFLRCAGTAARGKFAAARMSLVPFFVTSRLSSVSRPGREGPRYFGKSFETSLAFRLRKD